MPPTKTTHQNSSSSRGKVVGGLCVALLVTLGAWYLTRPAVRLSGEEYEIAMALYRVCNQKSSEGLDEIEQILADQMAPSQPSTPSAQRLRSIIDDARQEGWQQAARDCRRLLEEQVKR